MNAYTAAYREIRNQIRICRAYNVKVNMSYIVCGIIRNYGRSGLKAAESFMNTSGQYAVIS